MATVFKPGTTEFGRGNADGPPETFTALADITSIDGPNISRSTRDSTTLDNSDDFRTFAGTLADAGEVTVNMKLSLAEYQTLLGDMEDDEPINYQILYASGSHLVFAAVLTGVNHTGSIDDGEFTATATLKVSGKPTLTVA